MAKGQTTNGQAELPDSWKDWPTMLDATKKLEVHHSVVRKLAADGLLKEIVGPDGVRRFSPADLTNVQAYVSNLPDDEKAPPVRAVGGITHEEFAGATSLVKQVYQHHEKMMDLMLNSWNAVMTVGREQSDRDAKRIAELEAMRDSAAQAREQMISQEHDRVLAETMVKAAEARKAKAFSALVDTAGPLLVKKLGLEKDPMIGTALGLFKSMTREQILMLCSPVVDFVTPDQKAMLIKILGNLSPEEKQGLGLTETPEQKEKET